MTPAPVLAMTSMEVAIENSKPITNNTNTVAARATSPNIVYGEFPTRREESRQQPNFVRGSIKNVQAAADNLAGKVLGEERKKQIGGSLAILLGPVSLRPQNDMDNSNRPNVAPTMGALSVALPKGVLPKMSVKPPRKQERSKITKRHIVFSVSLARVKGKKPLVIVGIAILCTYMLIVEIVFNGGFEDPARNISIGPSAITLLRLGARFGDLIEQGQWYRLVTPIFLHAGLLHLMMNLFALKNIGVPAENEFGHLKILFIFILSGIFGVLMSNLFAPNVVSVGASGGIFGLFGACWADIALNFRLYRGHARKVVTQLGFSTFANFLIGLVPFVDNFAHMGGMIAGFLMGLSLLVHKRYTRQGELKPLYRHQMILRWVSLIFFPLIFVLFAVLVFTGENLQDACPNCVYFTCIPLPIWDCGFTPGR
jgi:membrane associated rhomboid family serine protease